jgi:acetyltransferase-like isoleucine patch superfamily enzyme
MAERSEAATRVLPAKHVKRGLGRWIQASTYGYLWRYAVIRMRYRHLKLRPFAIGRGFDLEVGGDASVRLAGSLTIGRDFTGRVYGSLSIGNRVFFNRGCYLAVLDNVSIGNNCIFGEGVSIHDENHVYGSDDVAIASRGFTAKPIVIEDNVWVGAKATIVAGVHIGRNAVIGANAVVTRNIPAYTIAAGVPARVVRRVDVPG